jgi:hypothetical protein
MEVKEHLDGNFWRVFEKDVFCRDHPNWKNKNPLGPVTFDYMCTECDFVIENCDDDSWQNKMLIHRLLKHEVYRLIYKNGIVWSSGEGI